MPSCADEPELVRKGGPVPIPVFEEGNGSGGETAGVGGGQSSIPFCDALAVIRARCHQCHVDPPKHAAPVPFLTYEDITAPYSAQLKYSDRMLDAVASNFMPLLSFNDPPVSLMPPAEPLTVEERATLLGWLQQGALPEGGTDCP